MEAVLNEQIVLASAQLQRERSRHAALGASLRETCERVLELARRRETLATSCAEALAAVDASARHLSTERTCAAELEAAVVLLEAEAAAARSTEAEVERRCAAVGGEADAARRFAESFLRELQGCTSRVAGDLEAFDAARAPAAAAAAASDRELPAVISKFEGIVDDVGVVCSASAHCGGGARGAVANLQPADGSAHSGSHVEPAAVVGGIGDGLEASAAAACHGTSGSGLRGTVANAKLAAVADGVYGRPAANLAAARHGPCDPCRAAADTEHAGGVQGTYGRGTVAHLEPAAVADGLAAARRRTCSSMESGLVPRPAGAHHRPSGCGAGAPAAGGNAEDLAGSAAVGALRPGACAGLHGMGAGTEVEPAAAAAEPECDTIDAETLEMSRGDAAPEAPVRAAGAIAPATMPMVMTPSVLEAERLRRDPAATLGSVVTLATSPLPMPSMSDKENLRPGPQHPLAFAPSVQTLATSPLLTPSVLEKQHMIPGPRALATCPMTLGLPLKNGGLRHRSTAPSVQVVSSSLDKEALGNGSRHAPAACTPALPPLREKTNSLRRTASWQVSAPACKRRRRAFCDLTAVLLVVRTGVSHSRCRWPPGTTSAASDDAQHNRPLRRLWRCPH
eukprot:NODE_2385_length_2223_cov_6.157920.p1 GENE.NODE_2385_length_2223_cov_6.157920~~NODE_2385_length_2223_cov_6.157920.p1  ORF type:complete len:624 (-),score=113.42 NODE_2385_length_2223_cov_6.157920:152-2023(-)